MTTKVYTAIATNRWYDVKIGQVGNGLNSNNEYFHEQIFADGEVELTSDGRNQYQPPSASDYNRLYSKLVEEVHGGPKGELLTAAVEWRQSLDMITQRTLQILDAYRSFRKFDIPAVVKTFSRPVGRPASWRELRQNERGFTSFNRRAVYGSNRTSVTETWLEYWLGWAPAMGDIYNALDVLSREFPNQKISVSTRFDREDSNIYDESHLRGFRTTKQSGVVGCYADAQVTNYNLYLLNQMGLINPLETGFDIIPFSFVAGWFVNVKQMLGALTAFAGIKLSNTGIGVYSVTSTRRETLVYSTEWEGPNLVTKWRSRNGYSDAYDRRRFPGALPYPSLEVKFDRLSLTRAATAVSLLVEVFLRKNR